MLAWDKELERELPLALRSRRPLGAASPSELDDDFEYDRKGSVVVAETEAELIACRRARPRARRARRRRARCWTPTRCAARSRTPRTTCPAASSIPATRSSSRAWPPPRSSAPPSRSGAELSIDVTVERDRARADGPRDRRRDERAALIAADMVVVAAGVWTPELLETAGLTVPVTPRKGQIVVLERSPVVLPPQAQRGGLRRRRRGRHDAALQIAMVVESTPSGTALLGSSRQHVGFDREVELGVAGAIARRAARFFPILNDARALRVYAGLRPLTPDHVPIIGPFAEAPNICVATGHEGAGHRPRARHRRARRRLAHGRADPGPDRAGSRRTASPPSSCAAS